MIAHRGGFTILELLLASMFGAILMAALWGLLSTYERLFTTAEAQTEQAQLARSILDQLAEDLTSAIADNAASPLSGPAPVRRFGLMGTNQFIQVDVLRVPPLEAVAISPGEATSRLGGPRPPSVPELHTVQWRFAGAEGADTGMGPGTRFGQQVQPSWSGLVRRELDWETPVSEGPFGNSSRGIGKLKTKFHFSRPAVASGSQMNDQFDIDPDDPAILYVPEVAGITFRYFDGQGLSDEWNSLARKSLPMAVEVVFQLKTNQPAGQGAAPRPETSGALPADTAPLPADTAPLPQGAASPLGQPPAEDAGETYRLLVYLPSTSILRRSEATQPSLSAPPPVMEFRPPAIPAPPPAPSSAPTSMPTILPDQWMRSGQ